MLPADTGGLTRSRCSSYETESCLEREALRILAKLCTGGRTSWKGPEPFKKGIQDYRVRKEIITKRRGRETAKGRESGKKRGSRSEEIIQLSQKKKKQLSNKHKTGSKTNFYTGKIIVVFSRAKCSDIN